MATPIGHALAGYSVYVASSSFQPRNSILFWLCLLMAIAPDFDFLPGILHGQPNLYHQGASHSLGAGLLVSFAAALIFCREAFWKNWILLFFAYASHLVLDFFAPDGRPPYGQPVFWPISDRYYLAPPGLQILWGVHHAKATSASTGDWIASILQSRNLTAISIEVLMTLPMILLARYASRWKNPANKTALKHKNATTA